MLVKDTEVSNPPWLAAALAGAAVLVLYIITLAPTTAFWDTSEYIGTAHVLGIPHPPGNPLFVLLGRSWDVLLSPTRLPVAMRINLFSAFMSAMAHGFWFLVADRILATYSGSVMFRRIGAIAAVLLSATAFTVWNQSNVNEKVYTVSLLTIALLSWLAFRWRDGQGRAGNDNLAILVVFLLGLSVGNHLMAVLAAPALLLFVLLVKPRLVTSWRFLASALVAGLIGISVQLFLPIRTRLDPVINEADPRCESLASAAVSIVTFGKAGCPPLSDALARRQYGKPSMLADPVAAAANVRLPRSPGLVAAQVSNYLQYFDWQWARSVAGNTNWFGGARPLLTLLFIGLGLFGARTNWQRDRASAAYLALLLLTLSIGLVIYLNFKLGYSSPWRDELRTNTEVRERDYFFLVSFSLWGVWAGIGLAALWQRMASRFGTLRTAPVLAIALIPLCANWSWASRAGDYTARDWAYNLLMSVEPYGVVVTNGDNDTFPLWYVQEVEGVRRDVTVIVMSYLNTGWYARQLRDRTTPCADGLTAGADPTRITCQPAYAATAGSPYPDPATPRDGPQSVARANAPGQRAPTHTILAMSDEEIERVAGTAYVSDAVTFQTDSIRGSIREGTFIEPSDLFLAQIIKSSIADRPIYFAMTTSSYTKLGLGDYLVREGVAYRLNNGPLKQDVAAGVYEINAGAGFPRFVDFPRTATLATKVFVHHPGFPERWTHWTDIATEQVPMYYASTLQLVAVILDATGDPADAVKIMAKAADFARLGNVRYPVMTSPPAR
jgi:hypothetical protein